MQNHCPPPSYYAETAAIIKILFLSVHSSTTFHTFFSTLFLFYHRLPSKTQLKNLSAISAYSNPLH